jgi:hypothetical protein
VAGALCLVSAGAAVRANKQGSRLPRAVPVAHYGAEFVAILRKEKGIAAGAGVAGEQLGA